MAEHVVLPATVYTAIATLTAAFVAGLVAFVSSVLSKEQKTSEFRYAWLNSVLDDIAKFTGAAESISVAAWSYFKTEGGEKVQAFLASAEPQIREMLASYYRARIRLYPASPKGTDRNIISEIIFFWKRKDQDHQQVLDALERLQTLLLKGVPDPAKVDLLIREIVRASHLALRDEWGRVKRGEMVFVLTKYGSLVILLIGVIIGTYAVSKALGY